jgi:hypothetical protein
MYLPKRKPTFVQLLNYHRINMAYFSQAVGIKLSIILALAARIPTTPETVEIVLEGLDLLVGVRYTLLEVDIPLVSLEALMPTYMIEEG